MESGQAFGTLLRRARRALGLTQEDVAERSRVSVRTISNLERGVSHVPHADTIALLAEVLGLEERERVVFAGAANRLQSSASLSPPGYRIAAAAGDRALAPFVGRQRELALLERHLAGQGPFVLLLAGEPGIGKTRLLHAIAARAIGQGLAVLEGGCQRRGGQEPYAPILAALKGHIRRQTPAQQRAALRGCAWLVRLLPELADAPIEPLPSWTLSPGQERRLMFEAVVRFLGNVTEQSGCNGTVLLLDDLQWAGSDALELLSAVAQAAADSSLRLVGAYRDTEVGPRDPLSMTLADLAHAGLAARHALGPLTADEAGQLLDNLLEPDPREETAGAARRERLVRLTGGVPFFLISYARAMGGNADEWGAAQAGEGQTIPWTVTQTIQQRVAVLSAEARKLLDVAAVIGRVVDPTLLAAVTRHTERDVLTALETAGRARLLLEEKQAYRFAHDVIREVIEADLGAARRAATYRQVAETLEQDPLGQSSVERLAYYFTQADVPAKAALYLEQAGDQARRGYANTAAEAHYREAITYLDTLGHLSDGARVREKQGAIVRMLGRHEAALAVLEQAVETYHAAGDRESVARALAETWLLHAEMGTAVQGARRFQVVVDLLEAHGGQSTGLAVLYSAQANLFSTSGDHEALLHAATRAVELAQATGDTEVLAEAQIKRGLALTSRVGGAEEGLNAYLLATRLGEAAGGMVNLAGWYNVIAGVHRARGEFARCRLVQQRSHEVAERQGNLLRIEIARIAHGSLAFYTGDWRQAHANLSQALAAARQMGAVRQITGGLSDLGRLYLAQGDFDAAVRNLEEGEGLALRTASLGGRRVTARLLAECELRQGRARAARARLGPLLDRPGLQETGVTALLVCLAWAHMELDEVREAERLVAEAITRLRADNYRLDLVDALRVQGLVAVKQRRWLEAARGLEEGLALARRIGYPYGEARLLHAYGWMYGQKGEPGPARDRLEAALAIFRQLGARKESELAARVLTTLG